MIDFITQNWQTITAAAGAVVMISRVIVRLTPTPKDDSVLASIVNALKAIGLKLD